MNLSVKIPLEALPNTRDLGGIETERGRKILPRRLIRSGELFAATKNDKAVLKDLNLKKIVDFRTGAERKEKPDPQIGNAENIWTPIMSEETMGITHDKNSDRDVMAGLFEFLKSQGLTIDGYMKKIYAAIVMSEQGQREYSNFFKALLENEEGALLWHCSAGKDRVGTGTALLLSALGVPRETIIRDFLFTNDCTKEAYEKLSAALRMKNADENVIEAIKAIFCVHEDYLLAALGKIEENFGSVENYLEKALGVGEEERKKLIEMYTM